MKKTQHRKTRLAAWLLAGGLGFTGAAQATLIDRGSGLIYDDELNITWLQDANYGAGSSYDDGSSTTDGLMTWANAVDWANALVYGGYDDWRLALIDVDGGGTPWVLCNSATEAECKDNELGYMYYYNLDGASGDKSGDHTGDGITFTGIAGNVWSGTSLSTRHAADFQFANGYQYNHPKVESFGAWAVRDGDSGGTIPEPTTLALMGLGLAGIGWRRTVKAKR